MEYIKRSELQLLKRLLSTEDIKAIASKVGRSESAVNATFWTRPHNETEQEIIQFAEEKLASLISVTRRLRANKPITIDDYRKQQALATWQQGEDFNLFVDVYTQMAHISFASEKEILEYISIEFETLFRYPLRVIELIVRLTGCTDYKALRILKEFKK